MITKHNLAQDIKRDSRCVVYKTYQNLEDWKENLCVILKL